MTERIGVVLSDVDGTQIKPFEPLPSPAVQTAAQGLRANGVYLSEVSSRSHGMIRKLVEPLALGDNLCCLDGGATVVRADSGDVVWSNWLTGDIKRTVVLTIGGLCAKINYDTETRKQEPAEVLAALESEAVSEGAPAIFAVFDAQRSDAILDSLAGIPNIQHTAIMSYDRDAAMRCIQVMPPGVDKQSGVGQTLLRADLTQVRALAIGDGTNDIPLFAAVGLNGVKVALNNADTPEELKDLADWVAPPVQEDGFVVAMERYGLA